MSLRKRWGRNNRHKPQALWPPHQDPALSTTKKMLIHKLKYDKQLLTDLVKLQVVAKTSTDLSVGCFAYAYRHMVNVTDTNSDQQLLTDPVVELISKRFASKR